MSAPEVSHGRGGAGNITPDNTEYADAEIVRAGDEGTGISTGRGGAANISERNATGPRGDVEVVPQEAMRPSMEDQDYHVGRGGAGNEHHARKKEGQEAPRGLADKLKAKLVGAFKKG